MFKMNELEKYINFEFVEQFIKKYGYDPCQAFQNIKNFKKSKRNNTANELILSLEKHINQVYRSLKYNPITLDLLKGTITPTQINKFITMIFVKKSIRNEFQQIRTKVLTKLKDDQQIQQPQFRLLYGIYKYIFIGKKNIQYSHLKRRECRKDFKSILISLKKMMVTPQEKVNKKKNRKMDPYHINVDIKNILMICQKKLIQNSYSSIGEKLQIIRLKQKKNKWIGPRLWQILQKNNWSFDQIKILIRFIRFSTKIFENPKSNMKCVQKMVIKIISNLNILMNLCQGNYEGIKIEQEQGGEELNFQKVEVLKSQQNTQNSNEIMQQISGQMVMDKFINQQDIERYEQGLLNNLDIFKQNLQWI